MSVNLRLKLLRLPCCQIRAAHVRARRHTSLHPCQHTLYSSLLVLRRIRLPAGLARAAPQRVLRVVELVARRKFRVKLRICVRVCLEVAQFFAVVQELQGYVLRLVRHARHLVPVALVVVHLVLAVVCRMRLVCLCASEYVARVAVYRRSHRRVVLLRWRWAEFSQHVVEQVGHARVRLHRRVREVRLSAVHLARVRVAFK